MAAPPASYAIGPFLCIGTGSRIGVYKPALDKPRQKTARARSATGEREARGDQRRRRRRRRRRRSADLPSARTRGAQGMGMELNTPLLFRSTSVPSMKTFVLPHKKRIFGLTKRELSKGEAASFLFHAPRNSCATYWSPSCHPARSSSLYLDGIYYNPGTQHIQPSQPWAITQPQMARFLASA
jgi:hypothetical protein